MKLTKTETYELYNANGSYIGRFTEEELIALRSAIGDVLNLHL